MFFMVESPTGLLYTNIVYKILVRDSRRFGMAVEGRDRAMSPPAERGDSAPMTEEYLRAITVGDPVPLAGRILIVDYDASWPEQFRREAARIRAALGDGALQVEHIGSTAVRGLAAKPIVDILLVV